ncbi:MAG: hypothetical protein PHV34_11570 [Verrucomicrobiae bacterium]|nr:hypothetical protein [Verrucomicrobiae bacterium]
MFTPSGQIVGTFFALMDLYFCVQNMDMKQIFLSSFTGLAALCASVLFLGCAMAPSVQRLKVEPRFQQAATELATAYLESQKKGESMPSFGPGAAHFFNLAEYKIVSCGWEWRQPAVFVHVKAGNKIGGNPVWANYAIRMGHNAQLEAGGDRYLGLRIASVGQAMVNF